MPATSLSSTASTVKGALGTQPSCRAGWDNPSIATQAISPSLSTCLVASASFPCPCLHPASSRPCFHPPRQVRRLVSPGLMLLRQGLVTQSRLSLNLLSPWLCLLSVALTGMHPHTQMWLPYLMVTPCAFSKTIFTCHFSCSGAYHSSPSSY